MPRAQSGTRLCDFLFGFCFRQVLAATQQRKRNIEASERTGAPNFEVNASRRRDLQIDGVHVVIEIQFGESGGRTALEGAKYFVYRRCKTLEVICGLIRVGRTFGLHAAAAGFR